MLASPDACSGAAHSACQPPSRQGEASQSANDALHAASIDGPPGTPSDEDKRKPSTIVQAEWRMAYSGWRIADGGWRMRQRSTAAFPRPSAALPVISHDARLVHRRDDDASDGYARLALRRRALSALAALMAARYGAWVHMSGGDASGAQEPRQGGGKKPERRRRRVVEPRA